MLNAKKYMLSGLSILLIGASHMAAPGYLVSSLHDSLTKPIAQMIEAEHPQLVVIGMGDTLEKLTSG